ncbi:MAG: HAD family hydrolase [Candidatus Limnocylindrales bacterium]|jgi:HAD superfamily hydrolase (TIGR01509 family)
MIGGIEAITFDFGNTLVPFPAGPMDEVVWATAERAAHLAACSTDEFVDLWIEERLRQFAEDVPAGREADMAVRVARVMARLRGCAPPGGGERWDDTSIARYSEPREVEIILEAYTDSFVRNTPVPPDVGPMLRRLARTYRLAVISNWPLASSIDRFLEAAGWTRSLSAVVVSQRAGVVKPHPEIFQVAAAEMGIASGPAILHVGDDLGADVAGASNVGWRTAWVRLKPQDSPLPVAPPAPGAEPDVVIDSVSDLETVLGLRGGPDR